ncbi:MAG TPA: carboxypeptidase-like regulatory domain-containing protein [Vicinamibacterales bacterium]
MIAAVLIATLLQQPRDTPVIAHGTAVISGTVVTDDPEARPVRHARIMLSGSAVSGQTAITDEQGRFVFDGLPAGRYGVSATKIAWMTTWYGARRPAGQGSAIPLIDGQRIEIVLRMRRGAVLSGMIHGYADEPAAGVAVHALHYAVVAGERRLVPAGGGTITDDRGMYRLYGLPPGDYVVEADAPGASRELLYLTTDLDVRYAASQAREARPPARTVKFAATYFPSATTPSEAAMVTLRPGEERDDIDVQIQLEPTVRIEGAVAPIDTGVPNGTEVILVSTGSTGLLDGRASVDDRRRVGPDGAFVFPNVAPGTYTLVARAAAPQLMWTSMEIAVYGEPVTGIVLTLQPGRHVSGRVRLAPTAQSSPLDMSAVRVTLQPVVSHGLVGFAPVPVSPAADGSFVIKGVTPGRYRLTAMLPGAGRPGSWLVRSAIIGGQDTLDLPITIQPNQDVTDGAITIVDRAASLGGTVLDANGRGQSGFTVVLFPTDQALWMPQARRIQAVRSSADGAFAISGLPAGEYLVSAVEDAEPGEWFDPVFLQRLLPAGVKLVFNEGETKTQDVRASGR